MSYVDQSGRKSPASIAAVVGVHLAIGYALLSGLAYTIIQPPRPHTTVTEVPTEVPPPPPHPIDNRRSTLPTHNIETQLPPQNDSLKTEQPILSLPPLDGTTGNTGGGGMELVPPQPPKASQARDAVPAADRLRWITTEDYPASALREGLQGVVIVSAMIGADGRVRSCVVTRSSGSQLLDDTTCRLYARRAHFTPARDEDGHPTNAQRTDRFRWQIPNE